MEAVYRRFDSYDFDADKTFRSGMVSLQGSNISSNATKVLEMKLFFYNRFVEPIDSTGYKQWHFGTSHVTSMDCNIEQLENLKQLALSESDSGIRQDGTGEASTDKGAPQLSFDEVIQLVRAGKDIPGVTKLDVQPSNQNPTPSQMERILKPWEISSVSK